MGRLCDLIRGNCHIRNDESRHRSAAPAEVGSCLLGIPVALVMFVLLNWITAYNGIHAVEGRPVKVLLAVAVFTLAVWLDRAHAGIAMVAGLTLVGLILVGLFDWTRGNLSLLESETDPRRLVDHGAVEYIVTALAIVLLGSRFTSHPADPQTVTR